MRVKQSFNFRGETLLDFVEVIVGQEASVRPALSVHGHVRVLTGDRLAVCAVLLLGPAVTETLSVGRPISRRVATEIRRYLGNDGIDMPEVTEVPLAVHSGSVEMILESAGVTETDGPDQSDRRRILFQELPSHRSSGRLFTFDKLIVTTNSWLYSMSDGGRKADPFETSLAVPVLMAQDLSASKITIPRHLSESVDEDRLRRAGRLLAATDLLLSIDGGVVNVN